MKTTALITLLVWAMSATAAFAGCPEGLEQVYACRSTPLRGDSPHLAELTDQVSICRWGDATFMMTEKNGQVDLLDATAQTLVGGMSYTAQLLPETQLRFSVATGLPAYVTMVVARLELIFEGTFTGVPVKYKATYSCQLK